MHKASNSTLIKQKALSLGFSACGIAPVKKLAEEELRLNAYLENNHHGEMGYMANHFEKRLDPSLLVPCAKSIVVVLMNYFPDQLQSGIGVPLVAKYAYGKDYHRVIKDRLQQLFDFINAEITSVEGRIFTDSAPVLERAWAVKAGLGWIGKNGLLLTRELGSFFFIGELIIDLELEYDQPYTNEHCGSCNQCLSACPTRALVKPYVLDARRCISYMTIELNDDTPVEYKPQLMNRVFGCDICQDVCPWNRKPIPHSIKEFYPEKEFLEMGKLDWEHLDESRFKKLFSQSAIKRAGFRKLRMNIDNLSE
jgi:epoxyqueuosine reductase